MVRHHLTKLRASMEILDCAFRAGPGPPKGHPTQEGGSRAWGNLEFSGFVVDGFRDREAEVGD